MTASIGTDWRPGQCVICECRPSEMCRECYLDDHDFAHHVRVRELAAGKYGGPSATRDKDTSLACEVREDDLKVHLSNAHDSHNWRFDQSFNAAKCRDCSLKCSRSPGGGGWGPGDWRYYGVQGEYTQLYSCPNPWPRDKPRAGNVRFDFGGLTYEVSISDAMKLRDRINAAIESTNEPR